MLALMPDPALSSVTFRDRLYHALNPLYATDSMSGRGAEMFGGRFNARGTPALYTSLTSATAIREANQVGALQPTILICYEADLDRVLATQDEPTPIRYDATPASIANPSWRQQMHNGEPVTTQMLAAKLIADVYAGLLVRSFAKGAVEIDLNLVLWSWSVSSLRVVDDEGRLWSKISKRL